jgi:hypothetical protein
MDPSSVLTGMSVEIGCDSDMFTVLSSIYLMEPRWPSRAVGDEHPTPDYSQFGKIVNELMRLTAVAPGKGWAVDGYGISPMALQRRIKSDAKALIGIRMLFWQWQSDLLVDKSRARAIQRLP